MIGQAHIIRGNALALPLADDSVDLVVTSPPYFSLRSYQDGGEHYSGQLGSEESPTEFVDALIEATREMARVLKPSGSIWINLGDKYAERTGPARPGYIDDDETVSRPANRPARGRRGTIPVKSLMGIPWRYANRCVDDLGLILRAEVIWSKVNGLPESVTDRVRRSHEQWFHFTLQPRYFTAVDEIRESPKPGQSASALSFNREGRETSPGQSCAPHRKDREDQGLNPLGKLPGSVWPIATEPLAIPDQIAHAKCCQGSKIDGCQDGIDHYAAFPTEWPRRLIQGWSPAGICGRCGQGRAPVRTISMPGDNNPLGALRVNRGLGMTGSEFYRRRALFPIGIVGYVCACTPYTDHPATGKPHTRHGDLMLAGGGYPSTDELGGSYSNYVRVGPSREWHFDAWEPDPTTPAVVLDPFGGTGTTALVAKALGRTGISVDMSADYCRLAEWRTSDPDQLAKASRVRKPPVEADGQLELFGATS